MVRTTPLDHNDHDGNCAQGNPNHRDFIIVFFQGPVQQAGETSNGFNSAAALGCHRGHASSVVVHNLAWAKSPETIFTRS